MAGLYVHVPFCRQACRYCDFYFTVSMRYRDVYVSALLKELSSKKGYTDPESISSVYLGGGTPSVLTSNHLQQIIRQIRDNYTVDEAAEITIEANPDDLGRDYLKFLKGIGFNRLSIGVQSFHEKELELMRRSHTVKQAKECAELAHGLGFDNINMDLIYGLPGQSLSDWQVNLQIMMQQPLTHLSAYHLTYEPGTVFHHWRKRGRLKELSEQTSIDQYYLLREIAGNYGFEHYEISNFALQGFRSRHNSIYWTGKKYCGFGPSAHSYNGEERRWNVGSLREYIEKINSGEQHDDSEVLSIQEKFHDYLITTLRTSEGSDLGVIQNLFGEKFAQNILNKVQPFVARKEAELQDGMLRITPTGWLKSDLIIQELMFRE